MSKRPGTYLRQNEICIAPEPADMTTWNEKGNSVCQKPTALSMTAGVIMKIKVRVSLIGNLSVSLETFELGYFCRFILGVFSKIELGFAGEPR